jgi:hypothetical protein
LKGKNILIFLEKDYIIDKIYKNSDSVWLSWICEELNTYTL